MNDLQVAETVKLIMTDFYFLKLEDLKLCFDGMKAGKYIDGGKLFDRLDGQIILLAIKEYAEERIKTASVMAEEKHKVLMDAKRQERYLIQVNKNYVRSCGDDFEEVEQKELATAYTYGVAIKIKEWIVREHYSTTPEKVKIHDKNKAEGSFFDYLEKNAPQLLPKGERFKRATNEYYEMKNAINANDKLSPFEKENAIRALSNLEPLSIEEYNERVTMLQKEIK